MCSTTPSHKEEKAKPKAGSANALKAQGCQETATTPPRQHNPHRVVLQLLPNEPKVKKQKKSELANADKEKMWKRTEDCTEIPKLEKPKYTNTIGERG